MKKLFLLPLLLMSLIGCKETHVFKIENFVYAYQTSEPQEYTHDIYLAHCINDLYIEIPEDYSYGSIELIKTGKMIYYYVYGVNHKVSNKGWERR